MDLWLIQQWQENGNSKIKIATMLEKLFKLTANKTSVKTEIIAGITTFMTMAYILFLNPNILSGTGMDKNAVFFATAISAGLSLLQWAWLPTSRSHWLREWG